MQRFARRAAVLAVLVAACVGAALTTGVVTHSSASAGASAAGPCQLGNSKNGSDQARDLPAVRQHALPSRPRERAVRPGADAAPAELPQGQRHARYERPHDPDLAHSRRDPVVADRALSGSQRHDGLELLRLLQVDRRSAVHDARSSTGPTRPTGRTTRCRTWSATAARPHRLRGSPTPRPAATSAACRPRTSSSRTTRSTPAATSRPSTARPRPRRPSRRRCAPPTSSASRSTARKGTRSATPTRTRSRTTRPPSLAPTTATRRSSAPSTSTRRSTAAKAA